MPAKPSRTHHPATSRTHRHPRSVKISRGVADRMILFEVIHQVGVTTVTLVAFSRDSCSRHDAKSRLKMERSIAKRVSSKDKSR